MRRSRLVRGFQRQRRSREESWRMSEGPSDPRGGKPEVGKDPYKEVVDGVPGQTRKGREMDLPTRELK